MISLDLVSKYLQLIESITGTLYLNEAGEIIESLKWMYQANHIYAYIVVMLQLSFVLFIIIGLPILITTLFTYERRKNKW